MKFLLSIGLALCMAIPVIAMEKISPGVLEKQRERELQEA